MVLDWNEYEALARETVTEGVVLLKNEKSALPLPPGIIIRVEPGRAEW